MSAHDCAHEGQSVSPNHELSDAERRALNVVLTAGKPVKVSLWGAGQDRWLSFYAEGTRLEARIAYPEEAQGA